MRLFLAEKTLQQSPDTVAGFTSGKMKKGRTDRRKKEVLSCEVRKLVLKFEKVPKQF